MKRLIICWTLLFSLLNNTQTLFAENTKTFKTRYTTVYYAEEKDLNDFLWRLGGGKYEFSENIDLASNSIDRIVEKVKTILGMWVKIPNINIYLYRGPLEENKVAYYDYKTKSIYISIENASDGAFAHEVAHAVINHYFISPPPSKVQEILTQYVNKY